MHKPAENTQLTRLCETLEAQRSELLRHNVYASIKSLEHLRTFMELHVFAVWDFMSLLKALQRDLTGLQLPWVPVGDPVCRRLINEIVLGEESDEATGGGYASHFELYREAMQQCGAELTSIDALVARITEGVEIDSALQQAAAPTAAAEFVRSTWQIIQSNQTHSIAAAFTFGREEVIPDMFRRLVEDLNDRFAGRLELFRYYLERHIELDEDHHAPLAMQMLTQLCGDDQQKWNEAADAALAALAARLKLWDAVVEGVAAVQGAS